MMPGNGGTPPRPDRSASVRDRRRGGAGWPRRRGSEDYAHHGQLALDPAVAPGGILPGQSEDDRHDAGGDARSTWAAGRSPSPPDQVPVSAEQGLRLHEEPTSTSSVHESTEPGKQGTIRGPQCRSDDLTAKHGNLVAEHDDFDRQLGAVSPAQTHQLEDPGEGEVEKRKSHGPVSSSLADPGKSWSRYPDCILGAHGLAVLATGERW